MRAFAAFAAVLSACCANPPPAAPHTGTVRRDIAIAEARRSDGVATLAEIAHTASDHHRKLALRGLGRVGGPAARRVLLEALRDRDPAIASAAATALGLACSLDEADAGTPEVTAALVATWRRAARDLPARRSQILEGLGRAANPSVLPQLVAALGEPDREVAAAAATALGRFGRRKIAIDDSARDHLVTAIGHDGREVRLAAMWALQREHEADKVAADRAALVARAIASRIAIEPEAEIRALAVGALVRRKPPRDAISDALIAAASDRDWRVAVEAMRGLASEHASDRERAAAASAALDWLRRVDQPGAAHVVIEMLKLTHDRDAVATVRRELGHVKAPQLAAGWIECLAIAADSRITNTIAGELASCPLPDHYRLPLAGEAAAHKQGPLDIRHKWLVALSGHRDPRVRAAALGGLAGLWSDANAEVRGWVIKTMVDALAAPDAMIAGSAADAMPDLIEAVGDGPERGSLTAAVVERARRERDPELASGLFELIGKLAIRDGLNVCTGALTEGPPVRARAAAGCVTALGGSASPPVIGAASPPINLDAALGPTIRWHIATTRGDLVIRLAGDNAPWAVAAIVELTRSKKYDGLEFHRVVPNFVVQGGDPTQSGWGGPGFSLPAEPSSGVGYAVGGVGMADAGRDSAGSQWFVMHSAALHLDGRYTWVGYLESGQQVVDQLLIGDRVLQARIELVEPSR